MLIEENIEDLIITEIQNTFTGKLEEFNIFWNYPHKFWCFNISPKQAMKENPRSLLFLLRNYKFYSEE